MLPHVQPEQRLQALGDGAVLVWQAAMTSLPAASAQSHAHPLPNRLAAALPNCSLNASKLPKFLSSVVASSPDGFPPPLGESIFQNRL